MLLELKNLFLEDGGKKIFIMKWICLRSSFRAWRPVYYAGFGNGAGLRTGRERSI